MRSPSIEWLHAKLDKQITLTESYTECERLAFIIKACRLKPHSYIFEKRDSKIVLHRWWFDEFGNSLKIIKNKRIRIIYNDLKLDKKKIVCTDLYYGLSLDRIAKMSKVVYICYGVDEDLYQDCAMITFLGIDNHLRSYLYLHGELQQVSPLLLGMKHLKYLAKHIDIRYYEKFSNLGNLPIPCLSGETWLSYLPPKGTFVSDLDKHCEFISSIFKKG